MRYIYPSLGVMQFGDDREFQVGISGAYTEDGGETVTVLYPNGTKESFDTKNGTIETYKTGIAGFTTDGGERYTIKPVETTDGMWISAYKVPLPVSNLKKMIARSQDTKPMPYLENADEAMLAFQLPDDEFVFGILYLNSYGAYFRKNGMWLDVAPSDSTFDGTISYRVPRDMAAEFVTNYDKGGLKIADVESYLTPEN
jgi:hypothetical protein